MSGAGGVSGGPGDGLGGLQMGGSGGLRRAQDHSGRTPEGPGPVWVGSGAREGLKGVSGGPRAGPRRLRGEWGGSRGRAGRCPSHAVPGVGSRGATGAMVQSGSPLVRELGELGGCARFTAPGLSIL